MVQLSCIKRCILAYHRPALFVCNAGLGKPMWNAVRETYWLNCLVW